MTILSREYYGGSGSHSFTVEYELYTIPNYTQTRLWGFSNIDIPSFGFYARLPDVTTLRGQGWNRLVIVNQCTAGLTLQHNDGSAFMNIGAGTGRKLALIDRVPNSSASWIVTSFTSPVKREKLTKTFNVGSDQGGFNDAETYDHDTDVWTVKDPVPLVSGIPKESACSEVFNGISNTDAFFTENDYTLKFGDNIYTQVALSNSVSRFSGMSNEGLTIYKIAFDSTAADRYDPLGDSWSVMPAPSGTPFDNTVSTDWGLRTFLTTAFARIYITVGTPDGSNRMLEWDIANQVYTDKSLPVASFGAFAPCMTGLASEVHMFSGSFNSTVIPDFSSTYHGKYDLTVDAWRSEPQVPVQARGMGCAGLSATIDRFTFGMGEVQGYPATQTEHYRYKTLQQVYDGRAFFAWGARARRENAWARVNL